MSERGYKIRNKKEAHFVTFTVVDWIDVFTRKQYRDIVVDSIIYCQGNKGLLVHAWCIMSNHMHLIASAVDENLSDILRDLKKFTSKQIIAAIENNEHESRREWMLELFKRNADQVSHNKNYQFWRQENQPKECFSPAFTVQKLNYIHNNPVEADLSENLKITFIVVQWIITPKSLVVSSKSVFYSLRRLELYCVRLRRKLKPAVRSFSLFGNIHGSEKQYRDIVVDSIIYCQGNKGLLVHAWCIMS